MNVDERLASIERRVSALEQETFSANESRLVRNTEATTATQRVETQARSVNHQRASVEAEIRAHEKREQQLLSWKREIDVKLAAHLATTQPTHGVERDLWLRAHEELTTTLDEINRGPGQSSSGDGYLRQMAHRDAAAVLPCLISTQRLLKALRAELETVEATG